ncbi:MAG TPA: hypothetical protein VGC52_08325 [Gemmatimonadaceae bacterium]
MRGRGISGVAFVIALTVGCGGEKAASDAADTGAAGERVAAVEVRDACSYVTKAEMETILGGSLNEPTSAPAGSGSACTYVGPTGTYAMLTVDPQGGEAALAGTRMAGEMMDSSAGDIKSTNSVAGLGDEAVMLIGGMLNVRKGAALVSVDLRGSTDPEVKGRAIVEKVLAKM